MGPVKGEKRTPFGDRQVSTTSYSLAIVDGDLVQEGSSLAIISGIDKLKQDLQIWVTERFGGDRFHPDMGSILQSMIGGRVNATTQYRISTELARVLDNYQKMQNVALKANPSLYSAAELLYAVDDISVDISYDTVKATVKIRSAANQADALTFTQQV